MAIDLPRVDLDAIRRRVSSIDLPERPDIKLPDVELPKLDLHKDVPRPDLSGAGRAVGDGVDAIGRRLDDLGHDLRSIRVVRGPEPRVGPAAGIALLGGLGIGMALMYFLDPRVGARRRNRLKDRLMGAVGDVRRQLDRNGDSDMWDDVADTGDDLGSQASATADAAIGTGAGGSSYDETQTEVDPLRTEFAESRV